MLLLNVNRVGALEQQTVQVICHVAKVLTDTFFYFRDDWSATETSTCSASNKRNISAGASYNENALNQIPRPIYTTFVEILYRTLIQLASFQHLCTGKHR